MFVIAIDTETYWDKVTLRNTAFIATSTDQMLNTRLYKLRRNGGGAWTKEVMEAFLDFIDLKKICEDPNIIKVFHNAPYDIGCLEQVGITVVPPYEDTMVMASLVNENFSSKRLKSLAAKYLGAKCDEEKELKKVISRIKRYQKSDDPEMEFSYEDIPPDVLYPYAKEDSVYTIKLYYLFKKPLAEFRQLYDMEMNIIPIVCEMTRNGFRVNRDFLADRIIKFGEERNAEHAKSMEEVAKLGIKFYRKAGTKKNPKIYEVQFNPRSTHHLRKLWVELGLPILKKTKPTKRNPEGSISTEKRILNEFLENPENVEKYNITALKHIARYKFLDKQLGTYAIPLYLHYTSEDVDRAHFQLWQSGAKTGRFSAELIQTMPRIDHDKGIEDVRMIRFAFIPEEGHILCFIDYEQIEMRLFAHWSKSQYLINDLNNGFDPHMGTVYNLFPKEIIDANPVIRDTFRSMIKAINFGIMYGLGKKKLILYIKDMVYRAAHVNPEVREPLMEIASNPESVLKKYQEKYPTDIYTRNLTSQLYRQGFVEINFNSELMNFRRIYRTPTRMAYKAVNMIVQGSAAYVMKTGMIRAFNWIKKEAPWIKLLLTIHDELVFEIPKDKPYVAAMLKLEELMEDRVTFDIPILASIKMTEKNWGEAYGLAKDGNCSKHGKLPIPDKWNITYCNLCKKRYVVVPYSSDTIKTIDNQIILEPYRGQLNAYQRQISDTSLVAEQTR